MLRRTYKFRLYENRGNKHLHCQINIAGIVWNHAIGLHNRYWRLTGQHLNKYRLAKHLCKLRWTNRYAHYQELPAQTVQDVAERVERAYMHFFAKLKAGRRARPPGFQSVKKYKSFTLKQNGWRLLGENRVRICGRAYKFVKSREIQGQIKTVTIKRDKLGRLYICFSVVEEPVPMVKANPTKIRGFDFGLRTFLTDDQGRRYESPEFLKANLQEIRRLSRRLSRKKWRSSNRKQARRQLTRAYQRLTDKRRDVHFKLALSLVREWDVLCFEDLNILAMQRRRRWGRKVGDLGFSQFLTIVEHVAKRHGKRVIKTGRWEPTSQKCSACGHRQKIALEELVFKCKACTFEMSRDQNAARNILELGCQLCAEGA